MLNCNDQEQVGVLLWGKHTINEDLIFPRPMKEGNILHTFGECSKNQRGEDASNTTSSKVGTSAAKHEFLNCKVEHRSGNSCQDCNVSSLQMDAWSDLHYISCVLNDGSDQDSVITELMNDLSDASNLYSGVGIMTGYNNSSELFPDKRISSLSKPCSLSAGDTMQLDGELEQFGHDDKGNDSFLYYDWANFADLDDLDKIFKNNDPFDGKEKVHYANSFQNTSADTTGNTSQIITVPGVPSFVEQTFDTGSPFHHLDEHSDANMNSLLSKKAYGQSQTWRGPEEEKGKGMSFQTLNYSYSSKPMSSSDVQGSNVNPLHVIQSPPLGQECLSKNQSQGATTSTDTMEEDKRKQSIPELSYLDEQYQSQVMSSSINGHSIEVAICHQLQCAMQKLDLRVRLNIRDSLFRLARNAMERLNASDRSCTDKNKDEESNNHDRSSSVPDSEKLTNPIDRIVAHLLFYNSSGFYSLPIGDGNALMTTSM